MVHAAGRTGVDHHGHPRAALFRVPGTASPETAPWAARHGYTYVAFLIPLHMTRALSGIYRTAATEANQTVTENNFGYLLCCYVADTDAKAQEEAQPFIWRMGETTRGPHEYFAPPEGTHALLLGLRLQKTWVPHLGTCRETLEVTSAWQRV